MPISLLATKLFIPPLRSDNVPRPPLIQKLADGLDQPGAFALLSSPPGFGKTTLLSEFSARYKGAVAWLSLEDGDNDPNRFLTYLIAALQTGQKEIGTSASALLSPQAPPVEMLVMLLINDLTRLQRDLFLILDDYHVIQNEIIHTALAFLLEHLPEKFHLIVSTRIDPPLPLARFRARKALVEIRAQDLRFTTEEAAIFLNRMMGLNLTPQDVAALEGRTEGWIAGLQLASLSMKGRKDLSGFIQAFTGSHIFIAEYLFEEVLKQQPEEIQRFLIQTSILDRLNAGLCEAVTGCDDGHSILTALFHANLFVVPLDDHREWYRYHQLFADLLKAHLQRSMSKDEIAALHRRAAAWYQAAGMTAEAIGHALVAEDFPQAVRLIEKVAVPMIMNAYFKTVEDWLQAIPEEFLNDNPRVNMAFAWKHLFRQDIARAGAYLERLHKIFSSLQPDAIEPSFQGEWLALQSMMLSARGKVTESLKLAEEALKILPEDETKIRSMTHLSLVVVYQQIFEYERVAEICGQLIQQTRTTGDHTTEMFALSYLGLTLVFQGKLRSVYQMISPALRHLEQTGAFSPFSATLYGELAEVYYQWHQIDNARTHYARSVELSLQGGFSDAEIYHGVFLSRLNQMEGNYSASIQEINKSLDRLRTAAPAIVKEEVISQQVSILLAMGRLADAQAALEPYGFTFDGGFAAPPLEPDTKLPQAVGLMYNAALRILLSRAASWHELEALKDGIQVANRVIENSLLSRHLPIALKTILLKSQMFSALGDSEQCLSELAKAVELAEPEGFISIFVEEGSVIAGGLNSLLKSNSIHPARQEYVSEILAAFPVQPPPEGTAPSSFSIAKSPEGESRLDPQGQLVEPLTQRELEVLRLIAEGDSNRAIAEKLVITVSAVKKHTGNIYGKLNVSSRTQALVRARQLGLLPETG